MAKTMRTAMNSEMNLYELKTALIESNIFSDFPAMHFIELAPIKAPSLLHCERRYIRCLAQTWAMIPSILFNDKRLTALVLVVWLVIIFMIFFSLGVMHSNFFRFGPSPSLHFMSITIDTTEEWVLLAIYCCVDTLVKSFGHDAFVPWLNHTLSDPKCKTLPYSKATCLLVMELYFAYFHFSYIFKFFLSLTQFDFVLIAALSDMVMKVYSYSSYMEHKSHESPTDTEALIEM